MKTVAEMRDSAEKAFKEASGVAQKAAHAAVGAPVVVGRRLTTFGEKVADKARSEYDTYAVEGERVTEEFRNRKVVTEIKEKVDFEHMKDRVEKLRDQLEEVLASWRESFLPGGAGEADEAPAVEEAPAEEPVAEKPAGKKATAKKSAPEES